jgi:hypothetical protein
MRRYRAEEFRGDVVFELDGEQFATEHVRVTAILPTADELGHFTVEVRGPKVDELAAVMVNPGPRDFRVEDQTGRIIKGKVIKVEEYSPSRLVMEGTDVPHLLGRTRREQELVIGSLMDPLLERDV